ncbi:hypothetical protein Sango_1254500 [Sesamum angolense]|uniref:Uncharacterized protein n=1 Tax=Sesamum angolense TaxID=2727404 RepID=A0AAE2BUA3_9LAMI|nr:hypothetical protein Sango_1254500 [Sesamum angolense]
MEEKYSVAKEGRDNEGSEAAAADNSSVFQDLEVSSSRGEKEWYFFCKRGRKYRNSEVWTLCRIVRRNTPQKKCIAQDWKHTINNIKTNMEDANSRTCSFESAGSNGRCTNIMSSTGEKEVIKNNLQELRSHYHNINPVEQISFARSTITSSSGSDLWAENGDHYECLRNVNWDELESVIGGLALNRSPKFQI